MITATELHNIDTVIQLLNRIANCVSRECRIAAIREALTYATAVQTAMIHHSVQHVKHLRDLNIAHYREINGIDSINDNGTLRTNTDDPSSNDSAISAVIY